MSRPSNIYACRIFKTAESGFGNVASGDSRTLPLLADPQPTFGDTRLVADFRTIKLRQRIGEVGPQKPTFTCELPVTGSGTVANATTVTADPFVHELMLMAGFSRLDGGTATAGAAISSYTAGPPDSIAVSSGQGARFPAGTGYYDQNGKLGFVKARSTDALTPIIDGTDPTTGGTDVLYGMRTYYPNPEPGDSPSYTMEIYQAGVTHRLTGCVVSNVKFMVASGDIAKFTFDITANAIVQDTASAPSVPTFQPFLKGFGNSQVWVNIPGTGWVQSRVSQIEIDLGLNVQDIADINAGGLIAPYNQGRAGYQVTDRAMKLTATTTFDDSSVAFIRNGVDEYGFAIFLNGAAGNHMGLYIPAAELNGTPTVVNDMRGQAFEGRIVGASSPIGPGDLYMAFA